jgi:lysophospholipase
VELNSAATSVMETESYLAGGAGKIYFRSMSPAGAAWARIGLLHGYGDHCSRYMHFYRWLAERGVASCAIDFRGHGRSEGKRGFVARWEEFLDDFQAMMQRPEINPRQGPPIFLVAHSHGGLVAATAAIRGQNSVAGIIFSCPYFKSGVPVPWYKMMAGRLANLCAPAVRIRSGLRPEWLCCDEEMVQDSINDPFGLRIATPRWFITMQEAQRQAMEKAAEFKLPMLMLIGKKDRVAVPEVGEEFYARAGSGDKTLRVYPEMLHEVLREKGREGIFEEILGWMRSRI